MTRHPHVRCKGKVIGFLFCLEILNSIKHIFLFFESNTKHSMDLVRRCHGQFRSSCRISIDKESFEALVKINLCFPAIVKEQQGKSDSEHSENVVLEKHCTASSPSSSSRKKSIPVFFAEQSRLESSIKPAPHS